MSKKSIGVVSLGCDKNRVDTEYMISLLKGAGYSFVNSYAAADLIIVNTCAFINSARKEAIETILEAAAGKKRDARLVVTGCLPQKYSAELDGLYEVDRFLGVGEYDGIVGVVDGLLSQDAESVRQPFKELLPNTAESLPVAVEEKLSEASLKAPPLRKPYEHSGRVLTTPPHYAYLKIADGCSNRCTYCTIPSIRGNYRSREISDLVDEARALSRIGVKEVILVAQDVTNYGADLYKTPSLVGLLRALGKIEGLKIRLLYCYPERIDGELINELKINDSVIKYIDIPLQHCNSRILKLMGRRSTKESIVALLDSLYAAIPEIAVRTTFIAGFPGETEEEFFELKEFLQAQRFMNAGFFAYSPEEDTPSFRLKGHLSDEVRERRVREAYAVQEARAGEIFSAFKGTVQTVLIDETLRASLAAPRKDARFSYKGRAYCHAPEIDGEVVVKSPRRLAVGEYYEVLIVKTNGYTLIGELKES